MPIARLNTNDLPGLEPCNTIERCRNGPSQHRKSYRIQRSEGKVATQDTGVNLAGPVHPSKISYPGVGRWAHNYVLCQGFFVNTTVCCSKTSNWSYQYPLVSTKHPHPATQMFEDQWIFSEPPQL